MEEIVDKVKELTSKLDDGISEVLTSERYKSYLKQMSKFHKYSYSNTILIWLQNPNATLVAGYKTWETQFKRNVNKGEKGIKILAPCPFKTQQKKEVVNESGEKEIKLIDVIIPKFKTVSVFDISQTSGEPLKQIAEELKGACKDYKNLFESIKKCSEYNIVFKGGIKEKGYCDFENKVITIKENMSEIQNIKTLIHEIAHEKLHSEIKGNISRNQEEVEAESIAFVVSNYFGIDTSSYSFDYISSWQEKESADVKSSLQTIQETSSMLIETIKNNLSLEKEISIAEKIKSAQEKASHQGAEDKQKTKDKNVAL